jgi:tRNA (cmo5U34)-methyltransferase
MLEPWIIRWILREVGFSDVSLFYAGFAFRGWVAYA